MEWGPMIPYMITAHLNRHPRAAIEMRQSQNPDDFVGFYDRMVEEE
jgi:4-hydroxy 2-oxovalerate aldolase